LDSFDKLLIKQLIAAAPLMPVNAMTEAEIEELARQIEQDGSLWASPRELALAAIRATLARGPVAAWPGEDWRNETALNIADGYFPPNRVSASSAAREMFDRLHAHLTGGAPKPGGGDGARTAAILDEARNHAEPEWIDWHGGECPVPAGTRVEVRFRDGLPITRLANELSWQHYARSAGNIIAYRILGDAA